MGNGNTSPRYSLARTWYVQIPLWAMATLDVIPQLTSVILFRFLYGQWQRVQLLVLCHNLNGFRFLYGQWQLKGRTLAEIADESSDSSMGNGNMMQELV